MSEHTVTAGEPAIIWLLNRLFWGPPRSKAEWQRLGLRNAGTDGHQPGGWTAQELQALADALADMRARRPLPVRRPANPHMDHAAPEVTP